MRIRLRTAALLAIASALTAGAVAPATAAPAAVATWNPDLSAGSAAGVDLVGGVARLDLARAFVAPLHSGAPGVPTGLLTLPAKRLGALTDHVDSTVVGDLPAGTTGSVDIRGRRANGNWTEWIPAAQRATMALPEPVSLVQARLVLTGAHGAVPTVRGVTLTARPAAPRHVAATESGPLRYKVFATREGLVGSTTANGHVIDDRDHFVALPSRRALSPDGASDYTVKVCASSGRCAFAPVWDVGPWNTRDDYWNPPAQRQQWTDLPQGVPAAQAAYQDDYNGGNDQYGRQVANPAGIDLGDGVFWDALAMKDNGYVTVDYLWTGSARLSKVVADDPVNVLAAPDAAAKVVGVAAEGAAVPVQCAQSSGGTSWLRIGVGEFVLAAAVPQAGSVAPCAAAPGTATTSTGTPASGRPGTAATAGTGTPQPSTIQPGTIQPSTGTPVPAKPGAAAPAAPTRTAPAAPPGTPASAKVSTATSRTRAQSQPWRP